MRQSGANKKLKVKPKTEDDTDAQLIETKQTEAIKQPVHRRPRETKQIGGP